MAAPTPTTYSEQVGHYGYDTWQGIWTGTGDFTDEQIIDLSGLTDYSNSVKVRKVVISASPGISAQVHFDCTTNQVIAHCALGSTAPVEVDFEKNTGGVIAKRNAGATGDIEITTTSAGNGDQIMVHIWWYAD